MLTVILDGENVLRALGLVRGSDLTKAEEFLQRLEMAASSKDWEVTVIFDGPQRYLPRESGLMVVRYAPGGKTADSVIEAMVYRIPDRSSVVVVTRDRAEENLVLGLGARVWPPGRLAEELERPENW